MTPENPIVGGTVLRIPAIQSPNFVEGSTGWSIQQNGDAFFANVTIVGGQIILTDDLGVQVGLLDGVSGLEFFGDGGPTNPAFDVDTNGTLSWDVDPGHLTANTVMFPKTFLDSAGKTRVALAIQTGSLGANDGEIDFASGSADGTEKPIVVLSPLMFIVAGNPNPSTVDEIWHTLTPANGWTSAGGANAPFGCRLMPDGTVLMRGALVSGTVTDGTQLTTLPAHYFNASFQQFMPLLYTASSATTDPRIVIDTSGNLTIDGLAGLTGVLGFDGVRFPVI